jgi:hypothetical protein
MALQGQQLPRVDDGSKYIFLHAGDNICKTGGITADLRLHKAISDCEQVLSKSGDFEKLRGSALPTLLSWQDSVGSL